MLLPSKLVKAARYPRRALVEGHGRFVNTVFGGNGGVYVMEQDWDNLVILDACRFDLFEILNPIEGDLSAVKSRGSHTGEFMRQNFGGRTFGDTVYVSANPNPEEVEARFHRVIPLWETGWDPERQTVLPWTVVDAALEAEKEYPHKRLIVHFLQPHYPWIGPEGRRFMDEHGYRPQTQPDNIWMRMRDGEVAKHEVWALYKENLEVTLPHIGRLVDSLRGKTVVTADHGNSFGAWDVYGHPGSNYIEELVRVPWLEVDSAQRKEVTSGSSTESLRNERDKTAEAKLSALGYLE